MDRSWLLCMPPKGMSAYARRTRVGRLRHERDRLWMDLQAGEVMIDLTQDVELTYGCWRDEGQLWLGLAVRQGSTRLSLQAKVPPEAVPPGTKEDDLDGPAISYQGLLVVIGLLGEG